MPEGHVIHRLAREINARFAGTVPQVSSPQGVFAREADLLAGSRLVEAFAYGKHLFIDFDRDHPEHLIHIHLGLIGKLRFYEGEPPAGIIRLQLSDDTHTAILTGPQWCRLIDDETAAAATRQLGADPLRDDADPEAIWKKVKASSRPIGDLLMDQKLFAGVGNIYRAEVLFRAGVSPKKSGKRLRRRDFDTMFDDLVTLMADGVRDGRIDTVRPEHTPEAMQRPPRIDAHGGEVYVYRREGDPCYVCTTPVKRIDFKGRNLFYCPTCQR